VAGGTSASAPASWEKLRDAALVDLDALIHSATAARGYLREYQAILEKNRSHLAGGGRASGMTALFDIRAVRTSATDHLKRIEQARGISRLSLWRLQLAEGATIAEIARLWGFSRQLVSRALASGPER